MPTVTIQVPDERIYNLLCSANYGSCITYWARLVGERPATEPHIFGEDPQNFEALPLAGGAWILEDHEADERKSFALDRAAIDRGIQVMAEKYPRHFANLMEENDDAITADVFIQCCVLGDVLY